MKLRSRLAYAVLASLIIAPLSALQGCGDVPQLEDRAASQSIFGSLSLAIGGLPRGHHAQATTADIERLELLVTSDGGTHQTRSINRSQLLEGTSTVSFGQLPEGTVFVSLKVFDRTSVEIGSSAAVAPIKAGQLTHVELTVQLAPTYVLAPDSLAINISFRDGPVIQVPADHPSQPAVQPPIRFVAAQNRGRIFLFDTVLQDVYALTTASAGLEETEVLHASAFEDGRVLFQAGQYIYYYDIYSEERVTVAFDARQPSMGGARLAVTRSGSSITYINQQGEIIRKLREGNFYTKTQVLTNVAAAVGIVDDIDVSDDDRLLVLSSEGRVHLYDFIASTLSRVELDANPTVKAAFPGNYPYVQDVAISSVGGFIAFTARGSSDSAIMTKLFVLDRIADQVSEVPVKPAADRSAANGITDILLGGNALYFVLREGDVANLWKFTLEGHVAQSVVTLSINR